MQLLYLAEGINVAGFIVAYWRTSDKLTDFSYGATFLAIAIAAYFSGSKSNLDKLLLGVVGLWAVRIAFFLLIRILKTKKDKRFDGVRESFLKFGRFWVLQGITAWIILIPAIYLLRGNFSGIKTLSYIGAAVSLLALILETTADLQKFRFNNNPANKGHFISIGVWKFSRHPNYFGEISMWVGTYIFVWPYLTSHQRIIALVGPLAITYILLFVTGIPKLEKYADEKWGKDADYQAYKKRTSILVPLPPRK